MERAQRDVLLDSLDARIVNQAGRGELLAAVQHAMADRADFGQVGDHARADQVLAVVRNFQIGAILADEHVQNHFHRFGMGLGLLQLLFLDLVALPAVGQVGRGIDGADALDEALRDYGFILHVDQLEFQRRGTRVDNQNFHFESLLFFIIRFVYYRKLQSEEAFPPLAASKTRFSPAPAQR